MPMKNPPHLGRNIKENCLTPLGLNVPEATGGGRRPSHAFARAERPRGHIARDGHSRLRLLVAILPSP